MTNPIIAVPSASALLSAAARAAHHLVDAPPRLLNDPDALAICRLFNPSPLDYQLQFPTAPVLAAARVSTVIRSAFAREILGDCQIDQCVLLGAGLDTSVFRGGDPGSPKVWVVDRAPVLEWRSSLFAAAGIPDGTLVDADLSASELIEALAASGFDRARPALVVAFGLIMYLSPSEVERLFGALSAVAPGSQLVLDTIVAPQHRDRAGHEYAEAVATTVGQSGEVWQCAPEPDELAGWLAASGWQISRETPEADAVPASFWGNNPRLRPMKLVQLIHARKQ